MGTLLNIENKNISSDSPNGSDVLFKNLYPKGTAQCYPAYRRKYSKDLPISLKTRPNLTCYEKCRQNIGRKVIHVMRM